MTTDNTWVRMRRFEVELALEAAWEAGQRFGEAVMTQQDDFNRWVAKQARISKVTEWVAFALVIGLILLQVYWWVRS